MNHDRSAGRTETNSLMSVDTEGNLEGQVPSTQRPAGGGAGAFISYQYLAMPCGKQPGQAIRRAFHCGAQLEMTGSQPATRIVDG